jgi:hypothetical protein
MAISYLSGGESATAARMNALLAELDRKLAKILAGGKSFFLATQQDSTVGTTTPLRFPYFLIGQPFFFTSGIANYARAVETYVNLGTEANPIARPYDHTQFTDIADALTPTGYDETNKIARINRPDPSAWGTLPIDYLPGTANTVERPGKSFFDWSLQTHFTLHQGASDAEAVAYYYQENSNGPLAPAPGPEKYWDRALAEIIIEGPAEILFPRIYDKYKCFRFHNLNPFPVAVSFEDAEPNSGFTLQPFECWTVRRDDEISGYQRPYHYFIPFKSNDPRFMANIPTNGGFDNAGVFFYANGREWSPRGSVFANNIANPFILLEWIKYFDAIDTSATNGFGPVCNWVEDESVQCDMSTELRDIYADPKGPDTDLAGDLFHHSGKIIIAKVNRTQKIPGTTWPIVEFDEVQFNGYATMQSDFAAKGIIVKTNLTPWQITASDATWKYDLIPVGTNLLQAEDTGNQGLPTRSTVRVFQDIQQTPISIPKRIYEVTPYGTDYGGHFVYAPAVVRQRQQTSTTQTQTYVDIDGTTKTATGNPLYSVTLRPSPTSRVSLTALNALKLGDLRSLNWAGDSAYVSTSQNDAFVTFQNRELMFTPQGLRITFDEVEQIYGNRSRASAFYYLTKGDFFDGGGQAPIRWNDISQSSTQLKVSRSIGFRGWGFGWPQGGVRYAAFAGGRYPWWRQAAPIRALTGGVSGEDLDITTFSADATELQMMLAADYLVDFKADHNSNTIGNALPFYFRGGSVASIRAFLTYRYVNQFTSGGVTYNPWYAQPINRINVLTNSVATSEPWVFPLLAEHYNMLAREINARTSGKILPLDSIIFRVNGRFAKLTRPNGAYISHATGTYPVPVDFYASIPAGSDQDAICTLLGIPILGEADLPPSYAACKDYVATHQKIVLRIDGSYSNAYAHHTTQQDIGTVTTYHADVGVTFSVDSTTEESGAITQRNPSLVVNTSPGLIRGMLQAPFSGFSSATLSDVYSGIRWIRLLDLEQFGFEIATDEVALPRGLRIFDLPPTPVSGPHGTIAGGYTVNDVEVFSGNLIDTEGTGLTTVQLLNNLSTSKTFAWEGTDLQDNKYLKEIRRNLSFVSFYIPDDEAECEWKYSGINHAGIPELYSGTYGQPQVWRKYGPQNRKDALKRGRGTLEPYAGEYVGNINVTLFSQPFAFAPNYRATLVGNIGSPIYSPYTSDRAGAWLDMHFDGDENQNADYEVIDELESADRKSLAYISTTSADTLTPDQQFILFPSGVFQKSKDWWDVSDAIHNGTAGGSYRGKSTWIDSTVPESDFEYPNGAVMQSNAPTNGVSVTLIGQSKATVADKYGAIYNVLFRNPLGNFVSLLQ